MRRSLGRLIGSTAFLLKPYPTITYTIPQNFNALGTFNSRPFSQVSQLGEYHESGDSKLEAEAKAGCDSNPVIVKSIHTNKGNEMEVHKTEQSIEKGDIINLRDLLFTKNRDYLVKYIDNQQVKAEQLAGKVVVLYFVPLCTDYGASTTLLMDLYNDLQPNNAFEIVLVVASDVDANCTQDLPTDYFLQRDSQKCFDEIFSNMPWTAIPFSDITCRKHLQRSFGFTNSKFKRSEIFVVDSTGIVLQSHIVLECDQYLSVFQAYGALGYPFSDERIKFLKAEDDAIVKNPSLKTLLASPQHDYLISSRGEKVPIHTLEDKVVALFFYEVDHTRRRFAEELKMAYKELKEMNKNFEVVLVYHGNIGYGYVSKSQTAFYCENEESFWQEFKTMPWLALPFKHSNVERLKRIFEYDPYHFGYINDQELPYLIILGPGGKFIEPFGAEIVRGSKVPAYPFIREKVAELETERVKNLTLEMLWDPNTVFRGKDGRELPFSQLDGKRVILYFQNPESYKIIWRDETEIKFLRKLKERYIQTKGTGDEFEVIHIFFEEMECSITKHIGDLPWLVSLASHLLPTADLRSYLCHKEMDSFYDFYGGRKVFQTNFSPMLAFDRDGRLVRRSIYTTFENLDFPFYAGSLEEEACSFLTGRLGWGNEKFPKGGLIYSRIQNDR